MSTAKFSIKEIVEMSKRIVRFFGPLFLFLLIALSPLLIAKLKDMSVGMGVGPSVLYSLPLLLLFLLPKYKWISIFLMSLICIASLAEIAMLLIGGNFLESGMIVAILTTTQEEASAVVDNNLFVLLYLIPILLLHILTCIWYCRYEGFNLKYRLVLFAIMALISLGYYGYKTNSINRTELKWYEDSILYRPPYRFYCQLYRGIHNITLQHNLIKAASKLTDFKYAAVRGSNPNIAETYVLCIGESMRYDNISINSNYWRSTTPHLERINNIIAYSDYYSTACLTMYAVPLLISPATPDSFDETYTTRSIIAPFKEVGFNVFVIATKGQLLTHENREYLRLGMDSLVVIEDDSEAITVISELSQKYNKSFFIVELWGSHHPYYNYPNEFEIYTPTNHTDPYKYTDEQYFMNAYDNTILYTDYILSVIADSLEKQEACATMLYTSDHGESISNERYGHGFEHYPNPRDQYQVEYHVPLVLWYSDEYANLYPSKVNAFKSHRNSPVNADYVFYSLCGMADIDISLWSNDFGLANHNLFEDSIVLKPREILLTDGEHIMNVD